MLRSFLMMLFIFFVRNRIREDKYTTLKFFEALENNTKLESLNFHGKAYFQRIHSFSQFNGKTTKLETRALLH